MECLWEFGISECLSIDSFIGALFRVSIFDVWCLSVLSLLSIFYF